MFHVRLPLPSRFSFDGVVRSHGWYDLPPFSYDRRRGVLTTVTELGPFVGGRRQGLTVSFRARGGRLEAASEGHDRETLRRLAIRIFSFDVNLEGFARCLEGEPALGGALERGGGRLLRAPTIFEDAVKVLLTTNCSWAATRKMVERLIAIAGAEERAFPAPESVALLSPATLRREVRCGYRALPLSRFARRVSSGRLTLSRWEDHEAPAQEIRAAMLQERGFGPYAAESLLRILGRHDYLALDSWTRQKYRRLHPGPARSTNRSIQRRYGRYGGFQGLALWLDMTRDWHEGESLWP